MGKQTTTVNWVGVLNSTATPQDIVDAPGAGKTVVVEDLTMTVEAGCLLEIVMETSGTRLAAWFLPAYGSAYLMNTKGNAAGKRVQVKTSVATRVAVMHNYHLEG